VFVAGAFLTLRIPALAAQVRDVLGFAQSGSIALLTVTTLLSGIAEELFFRGGLYAALPRPHQVWLSTVLYVVATVLTGNVMLAFAAAVLGVVTGLQRRATGGVLAPILTHVTWSLSMLHVLPHVI
jgi:membrane protease YdiL (CAAX protease family)